MALLTQVAASEQADDEDDDSEMSIRSSQAPATDDGGKLRAVKGTVLLHVAFASKQDQELGREVLKYLKSEVELSPFATAMALSMVR